jgi:hypothetical protein
MAANAADMYTIYALCATVGQAIRRSELILFATVYIIYFFPVNGIGRRGMIKKMHCYLNMLWSKLLLRRI